MKTVNKFHIVRILGTILLLTVANISFGQTAEQTDGRAKKKAEADLVYNEANRLFQQGTTESNAKALEKYEQASRLYREIDDKSEKHGLALHVSGYVSYLAGKPSDALKYYEEALRFFQINRYRNSEALTLSGIGLVYIALGEKQKALDVLNQALTIRKQSGDKKAEAILLAAVGDVYSGLGENQKGLEFFEQALQLHRQTENRSGEAAVLGKMGSFYYWLGATEKALDFYSRALPIHRQIGDRLGEAITLNSIGQAHQKSDPQKALDFHNQSLSLYRQLADKRGESIAYNNLGFVYDKLGEKQKALDFYDRALTIFRQMEEKGGQARVLLNIARAHSTGGDKQKALSFYNQSLLLMRQTADKIGEAKLLGYVMQFWATERAPKLAILHGKQAINSYQELRSKIQGLSRDIQKTYLETLEPVYRGLADILIAEGRIAEAEQVLDMLKEEEYFSYLRRDDKTAADLKSRIALSTDERKAFDDYEKIAGDITRAAEEYEALKKKIPFGGTADSLSPDERKKYGELERQYNAAVTVFNKFLDDLKIKFGTENTAVAKIESDTIGLLKKLRQPRTVIISTIVGEDRLNLIVTTSDVQKAHTVEIKAADLNKLVADFRETVKNPNLDPRSLGKQLYDKLFPAALQKDLENIKADTVVWSLDGTLRYVPMSALWDGEKYLVERYNQAVITLASRDKLESNANSIRQSWVAFGVGVSKPFENFNSLPAVPKELCSVVRDAKKSEFCKTLGETGVFNGVMLKDEEFTFDIFKQNLGKTPIVHVASHFALNPGEYNQSYLLLGGGENRKFSLVDVRNTRLDGIELLTLSACNTAMTAGNASNGLEVEGFGALAQNQGVKSVLATLWAVADDSTGRLMTDFYKILETDPSTGKADAVRQAQINLIKGANRPEQFAAARRSEIIRFGASAGDQPQFVKDANAPFAHPYFWSPFVLIGNWR